MAVQVPVYPDDCITPRVLGDGTITVKNDRVCIGRPFVGQTIGLRHEGGLRWRAYFYECELGIVEVAGHDIIAGQLAELGDNDEGREENKADLSDDTTVSQTVNQTAA